MKRLLMNCDQVFDVLTRGPFPTGAADDAAVEHHLRACHECRQLAEALRPAVALMHEAVSADKAVALPQYQGSLPAQRTEQRKLSVVRLAARPERQRVTGQATAPAGTIERRVQHAISASRFIAAALLLAAIGLVVGQRALSPQGWRELAITPAADPAEGLPSEKGLLTLTALKLPPTCMPVAHRPLSAEHAAEIVAALSSGSLEKLHCCTECHHAGLKEGQLAKVVAAVQQNCQACHRG